MTPSLPTGFDIQGHRGARGLKPENTLPSFETALDLGVTTLELDLHFTSDKVVVIWHDPTIAREKCYLDPNAAPPLPPDPDNLTTPKKSLRISQLTAEQVEKYRCDRNPDEDKYPDQNNGPTDLAGDNYKIPTLADFFEFLEVYANSDLKSAQQRENAAEVQINIETKRKVDDPMAINDGFDGDSPGPFEITIAQLVEKYGLVARVILQSRDLRSLAAMREINPDIRLAVLTSREKPDFPTYAALGAHIWSPRYTDISPDRLQEARNAGLKVIPWTVNEPDDMRPLINLGVDGIITDRPDLLLQLNLP